MDDQELCKAMYRLRDIPLHKLSDAAAGRAVRHWDAAGAMMEKAAKLRFDFDIEYSECGAYPDGLFGVGIELGITGKNWGTIIHDESLPRAIIEACVKALS